MSSTSIRTCAKIYNLAERYLDITRFTIEMQTLEAFMQGTIQWAQVRDSIQQLTTEIYESDSYSNDPDVKAFDTLLTEMEEYISVYHNLTSEQKKELDKKLCPFLIEGELFDTVDLEEYQVWFDSFKVRVAQNPPYVEDTDEEQYTSEDEYSEEDQGNGFSVLTPRRVFTFASLYPEPSNSPFDILNLGERTINNPFDVIEHRRNWLAGMSSSSSSEEEDEEDEDSKHYLAARAA